MGARLNRLEELLKKKGIGPEGSKSLKEDELLELSGLLSDSYYSLTTRSTILTALCMLPPTEAEQKWLIQLRGNFTDTLPESLHFFITHQTSHPLQAYLIKTITGNHLSYAEAEDAMNAILHDAALPDHWKGAFLEAQRLKRESFEENRAFFDVLWKACDRVQTNLPLLIDISDNYDGFNRYHNLSVFFAATLAALGYPSLLHGIESVAPKFGVTHYQLIVALKGRTGKSCTEAAAQLSNSSVGWAYTDQSVFLNALWNLKQVRTEMVKRPFLATFEKLLQPVRAIHGNHIMTGFTHAHYRTEVAEQLKAQQTCAAAMVIKGLEGSSCPPLSRDTIQVIYQNGHITDQIIQSGTFLDIATDQFPAKDITPEQTAQLGLSALSGEQNTAYYQILYYCAMVIRGFNFEPEKDTLKRIREVIETGKAYTHLQNGL